MVIADLIPEAGGERLGRVYLSSPPAPGDSVRFTGSDLTVLARTFLDLGPTADAGPSAQRLSVELVVR